MTDWATQLEWKMAEVLRYHKETGFFMECVLYKEECEAMLARLTELRQQLEEAHQTIEDVATGASLRCEKCGNNHPCNCDR